MHRPFILISNDDGIQAKGIGALWNALNATKKYELALIAPSQEKSGTGSAITWDRPLQLREEKWENTQAWSCNGNPADCIKLGLSILLKKKPDLIISGINAGSNAGRNILHSGTIGAVIEGVLRNIGGIAFSAEEDKNPDFAWMAEKAPFFIDYLLHHPLQEGSFLNINFPKTPLLPYCVKMTSQGIGRWVENPQFHQTNDLGPSYWLGGKPEEREETRDSDIALLKQGYVTVVPIHVHELTDRKTLLERQTDFMQNLFA